MGETIEGVKGKKKGEKTAKQRIPSSL